MKLEMREWHKQAVCATVDPELWFYEPTLGYEMTKEIKEQIAIAKNICSECPVKVKCLQQGLEEENLIQGTIWGGFTFRERKNMLNGRVVN